MEEIVLSALMDILGCGDTIDIGDRETATELAVERLQKAGYGNVKQAVKEFAEKLEYNLENFYGYECIDLRTQEFSGGEVLKAIKNTFRELYGE